MRLEIAMDDAGRARGLEAVRDLLARASRACGELEPALAAQLVREVVAAQPLHREERDLAGRRADLEHAHDVRAVELRGGLRLADEPRDVRRVRRACRRGAA